MGATYELAATLRDKVGKGAARAVRRSGQVPAVIYGGKQDPVSIALDDREIFHKVHGGGFFTTVATIAVGKDKIRAIPRDYQLDPVTDRPVHVDFLRVSEGQTITVWVPVQFINEGTAPGIKRGGVLNVVRHRIEVNCPVDAIPEKIVADLAGLDINDALHISHVPLPEGVKPTITDRDFTVATIAAPAGVKEELRAAAEAAAKAAETAVPAEGAAAAPAAGSEAKAGEAKAGGDAKKG